jgi:hypothetical protein
MTPKTHAIDSSIMFEWAQDIVIRQWTDLLARPSGELSFRFVLQPTMAILFAIRDGFKDARKGRSPYFSALIHDPSHRPARLRDGLKSTWRVILLGIVMDAIYQVSAFGTFYPVEMIIVVFVLAFLPYLAARGPADRFAHWWRSRRTHSRAPSGP